ncbi:MAG TPA: tRNA pseudouridine(38-40) synthase TruA [Salinimicrobium sp.]|nr:tRNA pseudouridine(38-40) synthase TruA [Salinimicrobium sp.]
MKTVEGLIKKTLRFVLPDNRYRILGSSRTDAMVSAEESAFELFLWDEPLADPEKFLALFNLNLPPDIAAFYIEEVDQKFNIIQHPKRKEYIYLFASGEKSHPFCAPLLATLQEELDIKLMKAGAKIFEGQHHFENYCTRASPGMKFNREIVKSEIAENNFITASFFPEKTYMYTVAGSGFLRNQIRLMMGTLILVGRGEISLEELQKSLIPGNKIEINYVAPASGLILKNISFN